MTLPAWCVISDPQQPCMRCVSRADRAAVVRCGVGKASFEVAALEAIALALVRSVLELRPKGVKGSAASGYILRANVASTMGPGFGVSTQALVQAAQTAR